MPMAPSIWRPARELIADARDAAARGDAATAVRLGFAATMHASTRGEDNPKYSLSEDEQEEAMLIWTPLVSRCAFEEISQRVNDELASDRERPATGLGAALTHKMNLQEKDDRQPFPEPVAGFVPHANGTRVRIEGLSSRSDLNGCLATVLGYDREKDRYAVRIDGPSEEHVRVSSMRVALAARDGAAAVPSAASLVKAAESGRVKQLKKMLLQGADANGSADSRGGRPLSSAAAFGELECVKALLAAGANPDLANMYGSTALHEAAFHGQLGALKCLLDHGALVDPTDQQGATPLVAACAAGQVGAVQALIDGGAKVTGLALGANMSGAHSNQAAIRHLLEAGSGTGPPPDWAAGRDKAVVRRATP